MPTNDRHAAHTRNIKNPYDLLRKPAEDRINRLKKLKLAGTLSDDAARQIDDDCKLQSHLANANHRERMRSLAFELTHPAATISTNQAAFVAENQGCITLAGLIALIVAEVIANNHPHDHPLPPGNDQLAADIARAHRKIDQIVRSAVKEGALSIRSAGLGRKCNQDQEVVAWLDSPALSPPPTELIVTHSDAEFMFAELGLEPRNWYFGKAKHGAAPPTEQGSVQPPEKEESPSPTANAAESQPGTDASADAEPFDPVVADLRVTPSQAKGQKDDRRKTSRMTEAKRAIRAILQADGRSVTKGAAPSLIFAAIREGKVPSPFKMREDRDESGLKTVWWTDTKGKEHTLKHDTIKRYAREAWDEMNPK